MKMKRSIFIIIILLPTVFSCKPKEKEFKVDVLDYTLLEPYLNKSTDSIYVVNFWATWCAPCVKEFPYFEQLQKEYKSEKLDVLMVSLDFPNQIDKSLYPFIKNRKTDLNVVLLDDPAQNVWIEKVDSTWSGALPATLVYKGNSRVFIEGPVDYNDLVNAINKVSNQ